MDKIKSYCSRCGKIRVISREWTEKMESGSVEVIEQSCPDKKCQKVIDNELARTKKKRFDAEEKRRNIVRNKKKISSKNKVRG